MHLSRSTTLFICFFAHGVSAQCLGEPSVSTVCTISSGSWIVNGTSNLALKDVVFAASGDLIMKPGAKITFTSFSFRGRLLAISNGAELSCTIPKCVVNVLADVIVVDGTISGGDVRISSFSTLTVTGWVNANGLGHASDSTPDEALHDFGNATHPTDFGVGKYGPGGGRVRLEACGPLTLSGEITANGIGSQTSRCSSRVAFCWTVDGASSGGSIFASASDVVGGGKLQARGGSFQGASAVASGTWVGETGTSSTTGGGGRVAVRSSKAPEVLVDVLGGDLEPGSIKEGTSRVAVLEELPDRLWSAHASASIANRSAVLQLSCPDPLAQRQLVQTSIPWACAVANGSGCRTCVKSYLRTSNTDCATCNLGHYESNQTCKACASGISTSETRCHGGNLKINQASSSPRVHQCRMNPSTCILATLVEVLMFQAVSR
eukprot:TRINITY_DN7414_c0_g1_i2.p1 TRINITY_DN7414_c0_g1~~TRINITY_DN7414_c0_g1_i2.p1  ORF type:complete len:435 (-),score=38.37 TRINITY_DN7414_c0_g1_i2:308-1612(-)